MWGRGKKTGKMIPFKNPFVSSFFYFVCMCVRGVLLCHGMWVVWRQRMTVTSSFSFRHLCPWDWTWGQTKYSNMWAIGAILIQTTTYKHGSVGIWCAFCSSNSSYQAGMLAPFPTEPSQQPGKWFINVLVQRASSSSGAPTSLVLSII
jgi:hypothetical protein